MLLDLGRQVGSRAEALSAQPGRQQNVILDAVEGRTGRHGEGTVQRVEQTLNQEMGPSLNKVDLLEGADAVVDRIARPLYRQVMNDPATPSRPLLPKGPPSPRRRATPKRSRGSRRKTQTTEQRTNPVRLRLSHCRRCHHGRQDQFALLGLRQKGSHRRINGYYKSGGIGTCECEQTKPILAVCSMRAVLCRHHPDAVTDGAYAQARKAASTKYEMHEGYDFWPLISTAELLPEEAVAELREMSVPARWMAQQGLRRELDRLVHVVQNGGVTARKRSTRTTR